MNDEPSNEEVMNEVKNIAGMMSKNLGIEDEFDENPATGILSEEELQELAKKQDYDIFDDVINPRLRAGLGLKYSVWVDTERVASDLKGLGKWSHIQKTYAKNGGNVKIKVSDLSGKYIKAQTVTLGPYISNADEETEKTSNSNGFTAEDFMRLQEASEEKTRRLLEQQRMELKEANNEKTNLLTTILGSKKDDTGTEMFKFMMQIQQQNFQVQLDAQTKAEERRREEQIRADERFEKLLIVISTKDDNGVDPYEQMKREREAEDRGYDKATQFWELLETKATAKAKELKDSDKDESVTDKAIKSVLSSLPQVAGILSKRMDSQPQARTSVTQQRVNPQSSGSLGMATISEDAPKVDQNANTVKMNNEKVNREEQIKAAKSAILEITLPIIGSGLMAEENYVETAHKVFEALTDRRINPILITKLFSVDDFYTVAEEEGILAIAREHGKEEQLKNWLKGFYNSVYEKTSPSQPRQSV